MKLYSVENSRRNYILITMIAGALAISIAITPIVSAIPWLSKALGIGSGYLGTIEYVEILFGILVIGLYFLIDKYLWRLPFLNKFFTVPDLNGEWVGTLNRKCYEKNETEQAIPVIMIIKQTYLRMSVNVINISEDSLSGSTASDTAVLGIEGNFDTGFQLNIMFEISEKSIIGANRLKLRNEKGRPLLEGAYVSSIPRVGDINVKKVDGNYNVCFGQIKKMKSTKQETYYGIPVTPSLVTEAERRLNNYLGTDEFNTLKQNRHQRDGTGYHITIVAPHEIEQLSNQDIKLLNATPEISFVPERIGRIIKEDQQAWYLTVDSQHGNYVRAKLGLPPRDFHITLGFTPQDIHGMPKDKTTWQPGL